MAVSLTLRPWVGRSRRSIPRNKGLAIKTSWNGKHGNYRLIWSYQPKCNPERACKKILLCFVIRHLFGGRHAVVCCHYNLPSLTYIYWSSFSNLSDTTKYSSIFMLFQPAPIHWSRVSGYTVSIAPSWFITKPWGLLCLLFASSKRSLILMVRVRSSQFSRTGNT